MIAYRAALDIPDAVFATVVRWIPQHRNRVDRHPWQRAASCRSQALLVLRCLKDATLVDAAARDIDVSRATGYRYFHEAVDVIAKHVPDQADVLDRAQVEGWSHIELDGTSCRPPDPASGPRVATTPGAPVNKSSTAEICRSSTTRTGSRSGSSRSSQAPPHDITAARRHVVPALNHAAATPLPVLVDLGYRGADIGYHHAVTKPNLDQETKATNRFLTVLRCICERGNALLKASWRYLRRLTCRPKRITQIARAALALTHLASGW